MAGPTLKPLDGAAAAKVAELFAALTVAADRTSDVAKVAALAQNPAALAAALDKIRAAAGEKAAPARMGAVEAYTALVDASTPAAQPYLVAGLPTLLDLHADKDKKVREAAEAAGKSLFVQLDPNALRAVLPAFYVAMTGPNSAKLWQGKMAALQLLASFSTRAAVQTKEALPDMIPYVTDCMWDTRSEVQVAAQACMTAICDQIGNKDIAEFIPAVISCIARPPEVSRPRHAWRDAWTPRDGLPCCAPLPPVLKRTPPLLPSPRCPSACTSWPRPPSCSRWSRPRWRSWCPCSPARSRSARRR